MKIAVIGTGLMGASIATRLTEKGFEVTAWNRREQAKSRLGEGVTFSTNLAKTVKEADVLLFLLSNAKATAKVLSAIPGALLKGKTVVQMGTIAPLESRELLAKASELEIEYLEAPVLGSAPEARNGTLLLMVGASDEQFKRLGKLFSALGENPVHVGLVGKAAALKLAINQLIAGLTTSFALSLGFIQREGIQVDQFMQVLRDSALYAPTFDKKLDKMLSGDYSNPNFPLKHLAKDVKLFIRAAGGMQTYMLKGIFRTLLDGIEEGHKDEDYSVLYETVDQG
jgi:3-hydroxyisobutyrate dehydrogenase-like beta-hydroxyacid dehydrogenase